MFLDKVGQLYKELGKVGFIICIISVLFLGAGYLFYNMLNQMMTQNQMVLETFIKNQLENTQKEQTDSHRKKFINQLNVIPSVTMTLENFCQVTNSDHVIIAEYHNSVENITTMVPFCKFTSTYEIINKDGVRPLRNVFQNVNISNYKSIYRLVHRYYESYTIDELEKIDKLLYYQMKEQGAKNVVLCSLEHNQIPWGFVIIIQYTNKKVDVNQVMSLTNEINKIIL